MWDSSDSYGGSSACQNSDLCEEGKNKYEYCISRSCSAGKTASIWMTGFSSQKKNLG